MTSFSYFLEKVENRESLPADEMEQVMDAIVDASVGEDEIVRFLEALRDKGETEEELYGLMVAMRKRMTRIDLGTTDFIDTCGTGGTGKKHFNISTAASLVAVAAGAKIAKHGNRAASSKSGSADFLEALGYPLNLSEQKTRELFEQTGFCFFYAPNFHPAMAKVAAARKRIGTKTIFNCLGPLLNPAGAKRQVIGVYSYERMKLMAGAAARDPKAEIVFINTFNEMDELTLSMQAEFIEVKNGRLYFGEIDPEGFGLPYNDIDALGEGTAVENAQQFSAMLQDNKPSSLRDCIALNAALFYTFYHHQQANLAAKDIKKMEDVFARPEKLRALLSAFAQAS